MINNFQTGLCYDDVLLVPKYSEITSRADIDLTVELSKGISVKFPLVPSNMLTICEKEMATFIASQGGMAIIHRFMDADSQLKLAEEFREISPDENGKMVDWLKFIGFSIGVKKEDYEMVDEFVKRGVKILCIDVAHGDSKLTIDLVKHIAKKYPDVFLIAGNVAAGDGAERLWNAGADVVKAGIGGGSLCTTRIETGNGIPTLTTLMDVHDMRIKLQNRNPERKLFIMSDGGAKNAGDCVKALCFTDLIMTGNIFAACDQTPGEKLIIDGKAYKSYVGSSTHKANRIEGVSALAHCKGPALPILTKISEGIQSGCSYQGVDNLINLKRDPKFVRITGAGFHESGAHDVIVLK